MKKARIVLFLLALVGLIASILLTQLHYKVEKSGFESKSFCNVSEFIDCDSVVASEYSSVRLPFLTIPNSELGILYYLIILIGLLYAGWTSDRPDAGRPTMGFLFLSLAFANVYSVVMAYISLGLLGVLCVMCLTTYVVNALLLLFFPSAMGIGWSGVPAFVAGYLRSLPRLWPHMAATAAVVGIGVIFFMGLNPTAHRAHVPVPRDLYLKSFESLPVQEIDVTGRPFWGNPNARVKVVEFSDFQCPFCRRAAFTLKPYLKAHKDDVALYFLHYPLDATCNPAVPQGGHPVACLAAKASVCAAKQGKFWDYHDGVFENQEKLSRAVLVAQASKVGLDGPGFESCLASDEAMEAVKKDVEQGGKISIQGTPSLFINGRLFRDWPDPERMRMVIESIIESGESGRAKK